MKNTTFGEDTVKLGIVVEVTAASISIQLDDSPDDEIRVRLARHSRIGSTIKIPVEGRSIFATVSSVASNAAGATILSADFLGELSSASFSRGVKFFPMPGAEVFAASENDQEEIFAPTGGDSLRIGTVFPTSSTIAALRAENLLSRHFAILGSTGTGKSTTLALVIHRLVELCPGAHVVILDPHNEYAEAFATNGVHVSTENLALPYWIMNFEEHVQIFVGRDVEGREEDVDILRRTLLAARKRSHTGMGSSKMTVDTPVPYKLSDLLSLIDGEMGKLDKAEEVTPFMRLKNRIDELRNDQHYAFMFSGLLVQDSLRALVSRLLRFPVDDRPVTTLDLSGVPSEIVDVVVSLFSRIVFDFALWSHKESGSTPILLVCEEAHRYVPNAQLDTNVQSARKTLERIAKEGRKYGVSLGLVSQRPSDLSEAVLSQCGTILSMRMNNERDRKFVSASMPEGAGSFLAALPTLQNRECIVAGEGVGCPLRVRLDYLEEHKRPASDDPEFTQTWKTDVISTDMLVDDTIAHWRRGSK